jgi:hypothetical protein
MTKRHDLFIALAGLAVGCAAPSAAPTPQSSDLAYVTIHLQG